MKKQSKTPAASSDTGPSPEAWQRLTAEADALAPAERAAGLARIEAEVADWPVDPVRRWWSSMSAWRAPGASAWVCGELRRAPAAWVKEILDGDHSEKHSLVRALSLDGTKATATNAARIFESPFLTNLRVLDCGRDVKLARAFYKKLAKAPNLSRVDTLVYYPLQQGGGEELSAGPAQRHLHGLAALRHLHVRAIVYSTSNTDSMADAESLLSAPWVDQLETLEFSMGRSTGWYRLASLYHVLREHSARFTSLRRIILHDANELDQLAASPVLDQVEELVLSMQHDRSLEAALKLLDERGLPKLRALDASQMTLANTQAKKDDFVPLTEAALRKLVEKTKLAKQVDRLTLST
ncbi:MAG: hypothetical protein U0269_31670 [Polyangiales bacterium]